MNIKERYQYGPSDKLGEGGFASVYVAYDKTLQRNVALKFYTNKGEHDKSLVNEIRNAISLEHPNLCRYYDVHLEQHTNIHGGIDQIEIGIMEFIDGGEIDDFLNKNPNSLKSLIRDVLNGLKYLHSKNIIHRDLKPSNILVKDTEDLPIAKIVDFGISKNIDSKKSKPSELMGTVKYMAPEQFDPKTYGIYQTISFNLDFWAFGLVLYELITKQPLLNINEDLSFTEIAHTIHNDIDFSKIERLPSPYREMVKRCIIQNANNRVKTADELLSILDGNTTTGSSSTKTKIIDDEPAKNSGNFTLKGEYSEGLAWAKFPNGLFGFIDQNNHTVIIPIYNGANHFINGLAQVQYQGRWINIDRFGNEIKTQTSSTPQGINTPPTTNNGKEKSFVARNIAAIIIGSLILLSIIILMIPGKKVAEVNYETTAEEDSAATIADSTAYINGESIDLNGVSINGYKGGMEDSMISLLKSDGYKNASDETLKNTWYSFDKLNFKIGTTELEEGSQNQIDNLFAILKAFPESKIKIGGFTDKVGYEPTNLNLSNLRAQTIKLKLLEMGIPLHRVDAEGYGSQFATAPAEASNDERAVDRKMAVRFVK